MIKRNTTCLTNTTASEAKAVYRQLSTILLCPLTFFILIFSIADYSSAWPVYRVEYADGTIEYQRMIIASFLSFSEMEGIAIWGRYDRSIDDRLVMEYYDEDEGIRYTFDSIENDFDISTVKMFFVMTCPLILFCTTWSMTTLPKLENYKSKYGRRVRIQMGRRVPTGDRHNRNRRFSHFYA